MDRLIQGYMDWFERIARASFKRLEKIQEDVKFIADKKLKDNKK